MSIPLSSLQALKNTQPRAGLLWAVDLTSQQLFAKQEDGTWQDTLISSSRFGLGNEPGSEKTPLGWHRVDAIIGKGCPLGQRFESRCPVGAPLPHWQEGTGDAILTRILWLDGLDPSRNGNSYSRYIYIHGTHQEERLGTPACHGCIRMGNEILAQWADPRAPADLVVWIGHLDTKGP